MDDIIKENKNSLERLKEGEVVYQISKRKL